MCGFLCVIAVLVLGVLGYAATCPNTFRVQRSTVINAPAEKIYEIITDLQKWPSWSPWEKLDPAMKKTLSGPPSGKGAVGVWDGNNKVGSGRMEIIDVTPPSKIVMKLNFYRPFKAENTAEYTLVPQGGSTNVTWAMFGPQPFMAKVMSIFMNCDKMVGASFEEGLSNLKALAE